MESSGTAKIVNFSKVAVLLLIAWPSVSDAAPDFALAHRYSFNEQVNDRVVHDSVAGADGLLMPVGTASSPNGAFTGTGEMVLSGGSFYQSPGGYVILPSGIISGLTEVTIEAWVTWNPPPTLPLTWCYGAWQRIFDFGSQSTGKGVSYFFLTPATDAVTFTTQPVFRTAITTNGNAFETPRLDGTGTLPMNVPSQIVVAYSPVRHITKMYLNGVPVAAGTATIPLSAIADANCYLGKSLWKEDAYFYGRFDEFRIYSGFLSDSDVAADYAAGPEVIGTDHVLRYSPSDHSSNQITLHWGLTATNLALYSSPTLGSQAPWSPVTLSPSLQDGRYTITIPLTNRAMFFRLAPPSN